MAFIIGDKVVSNLKGNLNEQALNAIIELIDSNGNIITPGNNKLIYNESYTINAIPNTDFKIRTIFINNIPYNNGEKFLYKPGTFPENDLNINIICEAVEAVGLNISIIPISNTTFKWSIFDESPIIGYNITRDAEVPDYWLETQLEGEYEVDSLGTYYVWAKDNLGNTNKASITAYSIEAILTDCELEENPALSIKNEYSSELIAPEGYYFDNIKVLKNGVDISEISVFFDPEATDPALFEFDGNTLTKYVGSSENIVIPRSYSIVDQISVSTCKFDYSQIYSFRNYTNNITVKNSTKEITYTTGVDFYDSINIDFPDQDAELISFDVTNNNAYYSIANALIYPVYYNDVRYDTYSNLYIEWRNTSPTAINFEGVIDSYGKGSEFKVKAIRANAFSNNVKNLTILSNIEEIPERIFSDTSSLETIEVLHNKNFVSVNNCLIDTTNNILLLGTKNSIIPLDMGIKKIGSSAFYLSKISSINIPNTVESLGSAAFRESNIVTCTFEINSSCKTIGTSCFSNCPNLSSIIIPKSVETIEQHAFVSCINLSSFVFEADSNINKIDSYALAYQNKLTTITFPKSLKYLGDYVMGKGTSSYTPTLISCTFEDGCNPDYHYGRTFEGQTSLRSATLPDSMTSIPYDMFYNCSSLSNIRIPDTITYIGNYAFRGCTSLPYTTYSYGKYLRSVSNAYFIMIGRTSTPSSMTVHSSCKFIHEGFHDATALRTVSLPNGLLGITGLSFMDAGITSLAIPSSLRYIGERATDYITYITSLNIPSNNQLEFLDNSCFSGVSSTLNKVATFPNLITAGNYVFSSNKFSSVTAPKLKVAKDYCFQSSGIKPDGFESLEEIGYQTFSYCTFTSANLPLSVKIIKGSAFSNCANLTQITINENVEKIGNNCFNNCPNLTTLNILGEGRWYRTTNVNYTGGEEVDLTDASLNAQYFKSDYVTSYWYRVKEEVGNEEN